MTKQSIIDAVLRVYDNGGKTADRYCALYMSEPEDESKRLYACLDMSAEPFAAQGVGMHGSAMCGPHLGKRIAFKDLPAQCQKAVESDLCIPSGITLDQCAIVAQHYLIAAVWADCEEGTSPRIPVKTMQRAFAEVVSFIAECPTAFKAAMARADDGYGWHPDCGGGGTRAVPEAAFGHDLWLTLGGHGTGFWDRKELGKTLGETLTTHCEKHGQPMYSQYRGWFNLN